MLLDCLQLQAARKLRDIGTSSLACLLLQQQGYMLLLVM